MTDSQASTQRDVSPWRLTLGVIAALVVLNASLTFGNIWPTPKITWTTAASVELAVCVALLASTPGRRRFIHRLLPAIWVALVVGHYADVTAPGLYGREFNVYWDSRHLTNVAAMLARAAPPWLVAMTVGGAILATVAVHVLARVAFGHLVTAMEWPRVRLALGLSAATVLVVFAGQQLSERFPLRLAFADPVTPAYLRQARFVLAMAVPGAGAPALGPAPPLDRPLGGLQGADVLLIFVESYGAVAYETPAFAERLAASRAALDAAIRSAGRQVLSAYVESPTFGGSSWLAHLSLISGVEVRDQYANASMMAQPRDTLVTTFSRAGYRTVALMPGLRQEWPEGAFYRFSVIYGRDQLGYKGPEFGWWGIPDQFALAKLDALERTKHPRSPLFVVFPTSTTHAPFGPVPPYEPDWSQVLTPTAYSGDETERALSTPPDLTSLWPSYLRAMSYEYASIAGYVGEHSRDDLVMIVIGDHQPPSAVSGKGVPWDVPVHVITNRAHIVDALHAHGFRTGLTPQRPSLGKMHELVPALLDAFGSDADTAPKHPPSSSIAIETR